MKKIKINDITVRDIFQNIDTAFINEKMLHRVIDHLSKVKFDSLEVFGGSAFEKMLDNKFFKTPFEIAHDIKNKIPGIRLQALIGARNLVGMDVYPKTVIKKFIMQCIKSGISRFRVFDSLNDMDNFRYITAEIQDCGSLCQGTIIYDDLKDNDFYVEASQKLVSYGCESICIKDVESTLLPRRTQEVFKSLVENVKTRFFLSSYNLRGLQVSNYYNACTEGCEGVDMSFIPSSYNDLSPAIFPFILSFKDTGDMVDIDYLKMLELFEWFKQNIYPMIRNEMLYARFIFSNKNRNLLPKWLLTSINYQLGEIGESSKIDLVLEEVFKIKNEIGNPSLSTPVGQIIGSQAILNSIISDYRWEITNDEIKKLIMGYYGKLPRPVDAKITGKISGKDSLINDKNTASNGKIPGTTALKNGIINNDIEVEEDKTYVQCASEIKNLSEKDGDILSYIFFPEKTTRQLEVKKHNHGEYPNENTLDRERRELRFPEFFDSKQQVKFDDIDLEKIREITNLVEASNIDEIKLEIDGVKISINKKEKQKDDGKNIRTAGTAQHDGKEETAVREEDFAQKAENYTGKEAGNIILVKSPIVGTFYRSPAPGAPPFVEVGSKVKKGDTLCIIEAMKLMNKINSDHDGVVDQILAGNEDAVEYGQAIIKIKI